MTDEIKNANQRPTFETHQEHQTVPYNDPALLPKQQTTYDRALAELTQEHPPVEVGALQVLGGTTFRFDGSEWIPTKSEV
jgi:hypothetical protein